jgi:hypothetical protein
LTILLLLLPPGHLQDDRVRQHRLSISGFFLLLLLLLLLH